MVVIPSVMDAAFFVIECANLIEYANLARRVPDAPAGE